jgi:hypothetical protein
MQDKCWATLLSYIPSQQHDGLMLVTTNGTEIAIQTILRVESQFMAIKGRLAGSQDTGRLFFIPFSRIDYFGFQKSVREDEFHELFGALRMPGLEEESAAHVQPEAVAPAQVPAPTNVVPPQPALAAAVAAPTVQETAADGTPARGSPPIRSTVLDRFRSRNGV